MGNGLAIGSREAGGVGAVSLMKGDLGGHRSVAPPLALGIAALLLLIGLYTGTAPGPCQGFGFLRTGSLSSSSRRDVH